MVKKFEIRNSTAEFLTFIVEGRESGIQVLYKDETVWVTQKAMAELFDCSTDNISVHLKNIFSSNELDKDATTEKISVVQKEGGREVNRVTTFYILMLLFLLAIESILSVPHNSGSGAHTFSVNLLSVDML